MCILKNPNIDVKDKEVPEHQFCECTPDGFCPASHKTSKVEAIGKFRLNDGWFDLSGRKFSYYYLCADCGNAQDEQGRKPYTRIS